MYLFEYYEVSFLYKYRHGVPVPQSKEKQRAYQQKYYQNNREMCIAKPITRRTYMADQLDLYKAYHGCKYCQEKHPGALDFHHLRDKLFEVSNGLSYGYAPDKIIEEVKKCEVLCRNCHSKLHRKKPWDDTIKFDSPPTLDSLLHSPFIKTKENKPVRVRLRKPIVPKTEEDCSQTEDQLPRQMSAEAKAKLSATMTGRPGYWKGKTMSPEIRAKMSAAKKGKVYSPEARANMSKAQTGKVRSAETRQRMAEAQQNRAKQLKNSAELPQ